MGGSGSRSRLRGSTRSPPPTRASGPNPPPRLRGWPVPRCRTDPRPMTPDPYRWRRKCGQTSRTWSMTPPRCTDRTSYPSASVRCERCDHARDPHCTPRTHLAKTLQRPIELARRTISADAGAIRNRLRTHRATLIGNPRGRRRVPVVHHDSHPGARQIQHVPAAEARPRPGDHRNPATHLCTSHHRLGTTTTSNKQVGLFVKSPSGSTHGRRVPRENS